MNPPAVAVGGVIFEAGEEGLRVLVVKRGRPPSQGRWSLPGGRVEPGERLAAAVAREIQEETGLLVEVGPLVEVVEVIEPPYHYVILDYLCEARSTAGLVAGDDAAEAAFVPVSELPARGCTELVVQVVARAARAREMRGA